MPNIFVLIPHAGLFHKKLDQPFNTFYGIINRFFSFFLDKKRNKKIKAVINVGGTKNLLTESIKATFADDARLVKYCRNVAVMPSGRQQHLCPSAH
ncbi:hypothetical protein PEDI_11870 [Persicobacter diffluens]|uniref:Uncharacterized protein n=2 Tax=Persicobacter diffluens TaxID=981 RepID=A0AAN4VYD7_9BACT|nr:hypothetical protein PEDI_11870 [Persicobacter diffluens]